MRVGSGTKSVLRRSDLSVVDQILQRAESVLAANPDAALAYAEDALAWMGDRTGAGWDAARARAHGVVVRAVAARRARYEKYRSGGATRGVHGGSGVNLGGVREESRKAVHDFLLNEDNADDEVRAALSAALYELYYGPGSGGGMSFEEAVGILRMWQGNGRELWYDIQGGQVLDSEPQGFEDDDGTWIEPFWEDYIHFDAADTRLAVFGAELAPLVR